MAKSKKREAEIAWLDSGSNCLALYASAVYKTIELREGGLRFLHLEKKGNTWVLLDALHLPERVGEDLQIYFDRCGHLPALIILGQRFQVTRLTTVDLPEQCFYHLDELQDGSWRITHSKSMVDFNHNWVYAIELKVAQ